MKWETYEFCSLRKTLKNHSIFNISRIWHQKVTINIFSINKASSLFSCTLSNKSSNFDFTIIGKCYTIYHSKLATLTENTKEMVVRVEVAHHNHKSSAAWHSPKTTCCEERWWMRRIWQMGLFRFAADHLSSARLWQSSVHMHAWNWMPLCYMVGSPRNMPI